MRRQSITERERVKIITLRYDFKFSQRQIARKLKIPRTSIEYHMLSQHKQHHDSPRYHLRGRKNKTFTNTTKSSKKYHPTK